MTRRSLLRSGWKVGAVLLSIAAGWTTFESLRPLARASSGGRLKLGATSDFQPGTPSYFREGRLWVVNAGGQFFALSQRCPHLGCRVPFCESSGRFECPCHGSVYDLAGEYIAGPAPRGLDRYPLTLERGELVADTSTLITGPPRGARAYLTPPRGPSCVGEA